MRCQDDISDDEIRVALQQSTNWAQLCRALGIKGGGSQAILKRRVQILGLSTEHFTRKGLGRKRTRISFICKGCGTVVAVPMYGHPKTYCSEPCLQAGQEAALRGVMADPGVRKRISEAALKSWAPENRTARDASLRDPAVQKRRKDAIALASQNPCLRAKRSANAKRRWEDPEYRRKMTTAISVARRKRVLEETCAKKPHVPYLSKAQGTVMVRSKWEADFALWLDRQGLVWIYEPLRVVVNGRPYTPDFFVSFPFGDRYVEVHWVTPLRPEDQKLEKMRAAGPLLNAPIVLVDFDGIKRVRQQLRCESPDWQIPMMAV